MEYYKVLGKDGAPCNGGSGKYYLPTKKKDGSWKPGKWMPTIKGDLKLCANGYHLCRPQDLLMWLNEEIYEAEYRGEMIEREDKVVVRQVRLLRRIETWNERTAREFACWCVRNTPLGNGKTTWDLLTDDRSKNAIEVSEKYARGEANNGELAAARAAAKDAARVAAKDAARAAAWDAARAAARAAARVAAWDAAWDAARAAAMDAAWVAAWAAARVAAWAAARDAARDAAWDAARAAQQRHLFEILGEREV